MMQRRRHGRSRGPRPGHSRRPKSYRILCSGCGKEVVTQVSSTNDAKLLCMECYSKVEMPQGAK
jgi:DNA-directed RNA polymerase subunit RPC12/RpoP